MRFFLARPYAFWELVVVYWIYVLINTTACKRYVGQTNDLERRMGEHNSLSNNRRFTGKYPGRWELVHSEQYQTRSEAMQREKWLKSGTGRNWLDITVGKVSPPQAD